MFFKTIFIHFPFLVFILTLFTFVRPCCPTRRSSGLWSAFLLVCAAKFLAFAAFGGDAFNPVFPERLMWVWNWAYSGLVILFVLSLAGFFLPRRVRLVILPAVAWTLSAWGVWSGVRAPDVREIDFSHASVPKELNGYRICQITDTHVSAAARGWCTREIVRRVNGAAADLVVCTGDIVDGKAADLAEDVAPLRELSARDGVYYVTGNHEHYCDADAWQALFARWGFKFLTDACVIPRSGLALGGLAEPMSDGFRVRRAPEAGRMFADATNGEFRVILQHRPQWARENAAVARANLQLSGHTHGGVMPVLNLLVRHHNQGFVRGLYDLGEGSFLYVSPGTGQWAGFPVRFFNNPEITVFTLHSL